MTPFQVDVGEQSVESVKGPETVMLLTERPVVPVLVTQTLLLALVVPMLTEPKETLVGDRENAPDDDRPVPESATVLELPAAVIVSVPVALPDVTGANTTEALQRVPGAMTPFQADVG